MYPRALPVLGILAAAAISIWPVWPPLTETWQAMPEYSYSLLLVPFIVCWIAARSLDLPAAAGRTSPVALATLIATLMGWLIAYKASSFIGEQVMVPLILWGAVWMAFGLPIARRLAVPLACLYFAIPVWEFLVPLLQSACVWVAQTVLGLVGIPVHINGNLVSIPEGTFQIAEACAGRRYFIVGITVAALLAGTTRMRPLRAIVFVAVAAGLSIITNWIRVLTVIYAGHVTDMTSYLVVKEHLTLGWFLFAFNIVAICLLGERMARSGTLPPFTHGPAAAPAFRLRPAVPATALVLLIPAAAIAYSRHDLAASAAVKAPMAVAALPTGDAGWTGPGPAGRVWHPTFPGAAAFNRASYSSSLGDVEVFVADYAREQHGAKLVSSANALFQNDWMVLGRGEVPQRTHSRLAGRPRLIEVETPAGESWMVSRLYGVGQVATGSAIVAQLAYGVLAWSGAIPTRVVAVATPCRGSCGQARGRLERFWNTMGADLLAPNAVGRAGGN